jgi:hypothetical protein
MQTVGQLRKAIAERADDEVIFYAFFDKNDADEYTEDILETTALSVDEWKTVARQMNIDEGVWEQLMESWYYYLNLAITGRKGKEPHSA